MKPIVRSEIQGSPQWLLLRQKMISATNVSSIMQLNPFKSAYALWQEKLGLREPEKMNQKMEEGMLLECKAREFLNEKTHSDFEPVVLQHGIINYLMASLDGINSNGDILEIKCGQKSHELAKQSIIPEYYKSQLFCQMEVAQVDFAYYLSYRSDDDYVILRVERDQAFIDKMKIAIAEFYKMLLNFEAPEMTDRDYVKRDDDHWKDLSYQWREAKNKLKFAEDIEKNLRDQLIVLSKGQSSMGAGIRISKTISKGRVDYSKIKELEGIDLEPYRGKGVTSFRFTETKE